MLNSYYAVKHEILFYCKKTADVARTEFAKKLWGDKPYCLRFDDVTMFTQP